MEERTLALARILMTKVQNAISPLMVNSSHTCGVLRDHLQQVTVFFEESFRTITNVRMTLSFVRISLFETLLPLSVSCAVIVLSLMY